MPVTVASLFIDPTGPYAGRPDVDAWDERRDARAYPGPHPVVAHPPCQRWGRFWWRGQGGERAELGDDAGCFAAAVEAVEAWGGVLEHPDGSLAWERFGLPRPTSHAWTKVRGRPGWSCIVDQGRYGHRAVKRTWLYYVGVVRPIGIDVRPHVGAQLTSPNTRRVGVELMGHRERRITPDAFADALIELARESTGENEHGSPVD